MRENHKKEYINIQTGEKLDWERVEQLPDNAMLKVRPDLWIEWDFEKNNEPGFDIWKMTQGSNKKTWWICKDCQSSFDSNIASRIRGRGCPYCSGQRVNHTNSLMSLNPELASEWHPTKNGDLTPLDVTLGSGKKVWWKCKKCTSDYKNTIAGRHSSNQNCPYCAGNKVNQTNSLATINSKLALEWHPTKNSKTPDEVTCNNNRKVWWLGTCGHSWDALISSRTKGQGCPFCSNKSVLRGFNDIWTTNPELASLLANPEDGYKYTQGSKQKVDWECPNCSEIIKEKSITDINCHRLACITCSDGFSYPEKVMWSLLNYLNVDIVRQKQFKWSDGKRYDFYIPSLNMIIETHGIQHFKESNRGRTLEEEQENDRRKRELALQNGIVNYIEIDCRESDFDFIKNNILKSGLIDMYKLSDVDWNEIYKKSTTGIYSEILKMWNSFKYKTPKELAVELKISDATVRRYLNNASKKGLCVYDKNKMIQIARLKTRKPVVRISNEEYKTYESLKDAANSVNTKCSGDIVKCCKGRQRTAHGYMWMYKEDYDKYIEEQSKLA